MFKLKQVLMTIQENGAKNMCDTSNPNNLIGDDMRCTIPFTCNNDESIETEVAQVVSVTKTKADDLIMYTNEMRVENSLLKLITDMNAPNYAFKKIMEWAKDAYKSGYQFNPKTTIYHSQVKSRKWKAIATSSLSSLM